MAMEHSNGNGAAVSVPEKQNGVKTTNGEDKERRNSGKTLKERGRVPPSTIMIACLFVVFEVCGGVVGNFPQIMMSWKSSMVNAYLAAWYYMEYLRDLMQATAAGEVAETSEYIVAAVTVATVASILYVLIWVPLRAGMWTGQRARRHQVHRYMGLAFLLQYVAAWIEFVVNYDEGGRDSYLPHFIAINGLVQGISAYFSFKVLPDLHDPGYYSDRAVLSRTFVHENLYFSLLSLSGSTYYNDIIRGNLQKHFLGRLVEFTFVFFPYILVRPWFPRTHFSKAGTSMAGRSESNERFYEIGTLMVKFFYLWAKYFMGFYINMLIFLNGHSENDIRFIRGLFLLNCGTVSIAVFLHTLRFKKVLPPKLAFSIYLAQIYATFSAIPYATQMFLEHKRLCILCFSGIIINLTRNFKLHFIWSCVACYLLAFSGIPF